MISQQDWQSICRVVQMAQKASMHCSIATVDALGQPSITPVGTLFLNDDQTGYFFDTFTERLAENLAQNSKVCIQAINSSRWFWLSSLVQGSFKDYPGIRLYGEIGALRPATEKEKLAVEKRIKPLQWTKGSQLIWSEFTYVRDISIQDFRWIRYPKMMDHLL